MKLCNLCNNIQEFTHFSKCKNNRDGLSYTCKTCTALRKKRYKLKYENNKIQTVQKICNKCKLNKDIHEFHKCAYNSDGYRSICKSCYKIKSKSFQRVLTNEQKDKRKLYLKTYYSINKDRIKSNTRHYAIKNKDNVKRYKEKYRLKNKQMRNANEKNKRKTDPLFRLNESMSKQINRIKNIKHKVSWRRCLEYNFEQLKQHLESKFTKGMSWENYGKNGWHIDHIIPVSSFKYDSINHPEFKKCWSLNNLQPLWATTEIAMSHGEPSSYIGNLEKGNKINVHF
jgi:hypothetical protein